jgi:amino acid transporter
MQTDESSPLAVAQEPMLLSGPPSLTSPKTEVTFNRDILLTETPSELRNLSWYHLAFICFVFTSGGPFGIETAVQAAGAGPTLALIFLVPLLHVMPMILIVTELSSWMPTNHGSVRWIDRAFGHEVGFISSILQLIINLVDVSIYPVLAANYICEKISPGSHKRNGGGVSFGLRYAIQLAIVVTAAIPAYASSADMSKFSALVAVVIIAPFVVGCSAGMKGIDLGAATAVSSAENVEVATVLAVGIWMYTGFMALGALGGEVKHHSVFLRGCTWAAVMDVVVYALPLVVAAQVPNGKWEDGYLVTAFETIMPGLGWAVTIAGATSGFGMYTTNLACFARTMWGVADHGWLPKIFARLNSKTGSPFVAVSAHVLVSCVLMLFDFKFLVVLELVISATNFTLFYSAFLQLRYAEPEAPRRFRVPGGMKGAWLLVSPITVVYFSLFAANLLNWKILIAVCLSVGVLVGVYRFVFADRYRSKKRRARKESAASASGPPREQDIVEPVK